MLTLGQLISFSMFNGLSVADLGLLPSRSPAKGLIGVKGRLPILFLGSK